MKLIMSVIALVLLSAPAQAKEVDARPNLKAAACGMQENVNLNVSFNIPAASFAEARQKFDQKMQQLTEFAKKQVTGKFELQSMNYNVNAGNYGNGGEPTYQLSGSASYLLDSADSAFKLGEFLTQQKFQVSVGVSKYKNGSCNTMMVE